MRQDPGKKYKTGKKRGRKPKNVSDGEAVSYEEGNESDGGRSDEGDDIEEDDANDGDDDDDGVRDDATANAGMLY